MKLRIKVTKEVLDKSKMCGEAAEEKFLGGSCAVALAIRDIMPMAYVERDKIRTGGFEKGETIYLPERVSRFIIKFDRSSPQDRVKMSPIEFEIEIPETFVNSIDITEITKLLEDHPTLELV